MKKSMKLRRVKINDEEIPSELVCDFLREYLEVKSRETFLELIHTDDKWFNLTINPHNVDVVRINKDNEFVLYEYED